MEKFTFYGTTYLIPPELVEEAEDIASKCPGWMGMYIEEFELKFEEYKL